MKTRILSRLNGVLIALATLSNLGNAQVGAFPRDTLGFTVSGTVQYKNTSSTLVSGVRIIFAGFGMVTGGDGRFSFSPIAPSTYMLDGMRTGNSAGINAVDALIVIRYFVGLMLPDSLNRLAADVNNDGRANAADAWIIVKHMATLPPWPFVRGDWVFLPQIVIVKDSDVTVNLPALCVGDVNGSFVPHAP